MIYNTTRMGARHNRRAGEETQDMDVRVGDRIIVKKPHPCGSREFLVLRVGMDFKIKCCGCGHEIMLPRLKCEKRIKKVIRDVSAE